MKVYILNANGYYKYVVAKDDIDASEQLIEFLYEVADYGFEECDSEGLYYSYRNDEITKDELIDFINECDDEEYNELLERLEEDNN